MDEREFDESVGDVGCCGSGSSGEDWLGEGEGGTAARKLVEYDDEAHQVEPSPERLAHLIKGSHVLCEYVFLIHFFALFELLEGNIFPDVVDVSVQQEVVLGLYHAFDWFVTACLGGYGKTLAVV